MAVVCMIFIVGLKLVFGQRTTEHFGVETCSRIESKLETLLHLMKSKEEANTGPVAGFLTDFVGMTATNEELGFAYLLVLEKRTWEEARGACVERQYSLAKLQSAVEHEYIKKLILQNPFLADLDDAVWIDGTDLGHEGCWVWTSPQVSKVTYTAWVSGQPDDGNRIEHCLAFRKSYDYKMNDAACQRSLPFLCKRQLGKPIYTKEPSFKYINTNVCG